MTWRFAVALIAAYFVGAIPTSYLVVRWVKKIDLRTVGSGNLGATNLYRVLGWGYAIPVAAFDTFKGAVPVVWFASWAGVGNFGALALGVMAVIGHVFSVFMRFKGGKGVATGGGVVLGLAPVAFLATLALWVGTVRASGYVSLGSILAALALPPAIYLLAPSRRSLIVGMAVLALAVVWLHRANIKRLLRGTEHRFGKRAKASRAS